MTALLVALGAAVGAPLRYVAGHVLDDRFHRGTILVNWVGSLLLGFFSGLGLTGHTIALLGTGVLGGFTTLSTYSEQARELVAHGQPGLAATYVVGTLAACLLAVAGADRFSTAAARDDFDREEGDE